MLTFRQGGGAALLATVAIILTAPAAFAQSTNGNPYANSSPPAAQSSDPDVTVYDDHLVPEFRWEATKDYQVQVHGGFDPVTHILRPDPLVSYVQAFEIAQIDYRCDQDLKKIHGQLAEMAKTGLKVGFWETLGTAVGTVIGYTPIRGFSTIFKEVVAPTGGAAFGGGIATGQIEVAELMSMAKYVCMSERVSMSRSVANGDLKDIAIVPALRMHADPAPRSARGVPTVDTSTVDAVDPKNVTPIGAALGL